MNHRHHILIVEDNEADLFLMKEAIESAAIDAELEILRDGQKAVRFFADLDETASRRSPDLILLDINLPRMNGETVLKYVRETERSAATKVLIVTSSDAPRDRAATSALAVSGYFRKPSEFREYMKLGNVVRELLEPAG